METEACFHDEIRRDRVSSSGLLREEGAGQFSESPRGVYGSASLNMMMQSILPTMRSMLTFP